MTDAGSLIGFQLSHYPGRINPELPAKLDEIARKALEKDRNLPYQHASDIRADLQRLRRDFSSGNVAAPSGSAPASDTGSSSVPPPVSSGGLPAHRLSGARQ
jgi:hypothetical protein